MGKQSTGDSPAFVKSLMVSIACLELYGEEVEELKTLLPYTQQLKKAMNRAAEEADKEVKKYYKNVLTSPEYQKQYFHIVKMIEDFITIIKEARFSDLKMYVEAFDLMRKGHFTCVDDSEYEQLESKRSSENKPKSTSSTV